MDKSNIDGRPDCAPSHWKQNFKIIYLTEKVRSQEDPFFQSLCDRIAKDCITDDDESFLTSRIQPYPSEVSNENFKFGRLCIIVTTNKKRNLINYKKLAELLPNEQLYSGNSIDYVMNVPGKCPLPQQVQDNPGRTGNLLNELFIKRGAPVVITTNHTKQKYREDGIMNGARGFVQAVQVSKENPDKVEIIWVVFKNKEIGKLYRFEHSHLRKSFDPGHDLATPILPQRRNFKVKFGNVEYLYLKTMSGAGEKDEEKEGEDEEEEE